MHDTWTWREFRAVTKEAYAVLGALNSDVDLIQGFYSEFPEGSAVMHFLYAGEQPTNVRHTVILNATGMSNQLFIESIVQTVDRLRGWDGPKFVTTLDEARTYLQSLREAKT